MTRKWQAGCGLGCWTRLEDLFVKMSNMEELQAKIKQLEEDKKNQITVRRRPGPPWSVARCLQVAKMSKMEELHAKIKQLEEDKKKSDQDKMIIIEKTCQQSPWRHLQFSDQIPSDKSMASGQSSASSSPTKSPEMNKKKRRAFRRQCTSTCQIPTCVKSEILKCAHIVPRKTVVQSLTDWGIEISPNSHTNVLLLVSTLEANFDKGDFCLLMTPLPGTADEAFTVKILNTSIIDESIPGTELKFKDLEDRVLEIRSNVPSHRCIARHCYYSLAAAVKKGWIESREYFDLIAQIKDQSPEQDKVIRVQEWLRSQREPGLLLVEF